MIQEVAVKNNTQRGQSHRFCVSKDARGTWKVERVYLRGVGKSCDAGRGVVQYRVQVDVSDPALKDALARAH